MKDNCSQKVLVSRKFIHCSQKKSSLMNSQFSNRFLSFFPFLLSLFQTVFILGFRSSGILRNSGDIITFKNPSFKKFLPQAKNVSLNVYGLLRPAYPDDFSLHCERWQVSIANYFLFPWTILRLISFLQTFLRRIGHCAQWLATTSASSSQSQHFSPTFASNSHAPSLCFTDVGALPAPSIEISHFSSASCSYPVVDSDPNREEESFFSNPSPDQVPIPPSSLDLAKNDHGDIDMASGYPDAVDEFELFCRIANSPARSSPPHSPRGAYGVSPMSCSPPGDFNEAQSCSGSPFRIAPPYARQRSRSVKEKSRNRLLLADDATARSRFSSKSMRERRQSRLSAHGAHGSAGGSTAAGEEQQLYRVRSFKRTAKGVVNQGDTFRTRSQCSLNSQNSSQVS